MANEEVLGPRKTMFVLVIVVGCFAVLWPRILSPLILGHARDQLKPNQFDREAALKQERPPMRTGPHPALRERGRAIPAGAPAPPARPPTILPPHARVRSSPLSGYFEVDIKPPPIPGMRPPLGSPGGPVAAPKSSMGFVMPIYTICIIVFFVYTLSKILFKRTGSVPYESVSPDPQFRRRVFRDDSRSTPDKLVVTAISGLVAEVQQQMEASYAQNQQRQELQENHARPYTNGTVLHNTGPVHIVASEYREKSPEPAEVPTPEPKEPSPEPKEPSPEPKELSPEPKELSPEPKEPSPEPKEPTPEPKEATPEPKEPTSESEAKESSSEDLPVPEKELSEPEEEEVEETGQSETELPQSKSNGDLIKYTEDLEDAKVDVAKKASEDFINDARETEDFKIVSTTDLESSKEEKRSTPELLEEALKEDSSEKETDDGVDEEEKENASVKVVGMEVTAHTADGGSWRPPAARPARAPAAAPPPRVHEAEEVKSIFLETEIPQQSRVLVTEFEDHTDRPAPKHSPMVVSGKMTLSLIQDAPRDTPDRDLESTVDDFTTASAVTQPAAEKEDELSEEEVDEEIEVEEIEEEVEEVEEELEEDEEEPPAPALRPSARQK